MTLAIPRLDRSTAEERGLTIADFLVPIRLGERVNARVRDVALVVAGALLIYLTARVAIPVPGSPVPITGQTFGVLLVGGALGFRRGLVGVTLYVLLGVIGLPFFAEGKGGISVIWGATGADVGWGHQIRSYVLDQSRIKDLRTNFEVSATQKVLDGDLDPFIEASLKQGV